VYQLRHLIHVSAAPHRVRVSTSPFVTRSSRSTPRSCINFAVCYSFQPLHPSFVYQLRHLIHVSAAPPVVRVSTSPFDTRFSRSARRSCINFPVCYTFQPLHTEFVYQLRRLLLVSAAPPVVRVSTSPFDTRSSRSARRSCINFAVCYSFQPLHPSFVYQLRRLLLVPAAPPVVRVSTSPFDTRSSLSTPSSCINFPVCYSFRSGRRSCINFAV